MDRDKRRDLSRCSVEHPKKNSVKKKGQNVNSCNAEFVNFLKYFLIFSFGKSGKVARKLSAGRFVGRHSHEEDHAGNADDAADEEEEAGLDGRRILVHLAVHGLEHQWDDGLDHGQERQQLACVRCRGLGSPMLPSNKGLCLPEPT